MRSSQLQLSSFLPVPLDLTIYPHLLDHIHCIGHQINNPLFQLCQKRIDLFQFCQTLIEILHIVHHILPTATALNTHRPQDDYPTLNEVLETRSITLLRKSVTSGRLLCCQFCKLTRIGWKRRQQLRGDCSLASLYSLLFRLADATRLGPFRS